jgi:hypothetical protein
MTTNGGPSGIFRTLNFGPNIASAGLQLCSARSMSVGTASEGMLLGDVPVVPFDSHLNILSHFQCWAVPAVLRRPGRHDDPLQQRKRADFDLNSQEGSVSAGDGREAMLGHGR